MKIEAVVTKGSGDGRKLGFPTLNLDISQISLDISTGVYTSTVRIDSRLYHSVTHYGPRAVFAEIENKLEVHVLDFDSDVYGRRVALELLQKLRPTQSFGSLEELIQQIKKDVQQTKDFFKLYARQS